MSNLTRALLVLVVLTMASTGAIAESLSFSDYDTRFNGQAVQKPDGSFQLTTTTDTSDKASVVFGKGGGVSLGTLASLTHFSADFLKVLPTDNPANNLAIRLWTNADGSEGLVWENNYNTNSDVPLNSWQSLDFTGEKFWERYNGENFDADPNIQTLSAWQRGFKPSNGKDLSGADIFAIQVSYGSGIGAFDGSVRNVSLTLGASEYTAAEFREAAANTPLPSAALGGLACLGLFATARARRRPTAA